MAVLVLGSTGHARHVTQYEWHEAPEHLNVADYEFIIMDLTPLADEQYRLGVEPMRFPAHAQLARAMFADTSIVVIGEPWQTRSDGASLYGWLPGAPRYEIEEGTTVVVKAEDLEGYFEGVCTTTHYYTGHLESGDNERFLAHLGSRFRHLDIRLLALAETRVGNAIAVLVRGNAYAESDTREFPDVRESGRVLLVPPSTERSSHESVEWWLRLIGIGAEHEPPPWASAFGLPDEQPLAERERELRQRLTETENALNELVREQTRAGRWRALLYETGVALEVVVRDALVVLGATVTEPTNAGREDGRLTDPTGRDAVLEIKGVGKGVKRDHIRQLNQWTADALADDGFEAKGILVVNAWAGQPPGERGELIAADTLRLAERWNQALLTTTQVFAALVTLQRGALDIGAFWDAIFDTGGLVTLPEQGFGSGTS